MATMTTFVILALRFVYFGNETALLDNYADSVGRAGGLADAATCAETVAEGIGNIRVSNLVNKFSHKSQSFYYTTACFLRI